VILLLSHVQGLPLFDRVETVKRSSSQFEHSDVRLLDLSDGVADCLGKARLGDDMDIRP